MAYSLRQARSEDHAAIRLLIRSARLNPLGIHWRRFVVAADEADQIVGCGQVKSHRDGSRELASIVVNPSWQGQGIGGKLIERLKSDNDPPLWLTCASPLASFYKKCGFYEVSARDEMPGYFRHVSRLFCLLSYILPGNWRLVVMKWDGR